MNKHYSKTQKVIKVGNSLAITLDKEFVDKTGIEAGSSVESIYDPQAKKAALVLRDKGTSAYSPTSKVSPNFKKWVEKSLQDDKEMLEILANL